MIKGPTSQKIYFLVGDILSIINRILPKKKDKILFFSSNTITDNSKALLDYLIKENFDSKYSIVCCAKNIENLTHTKYKNIKISLFNAFSGIYNIMTAHYIFYHGEIIPIKPSSKQISISLWHGTPLKRFNKTADKLSNYRYDFFTYLLASSDYYKPIMRDCFDCSLDKVLVLGHPRNDLLFEKSDILNTLNINKKNINKLFLWMPTYRRSKDNYIIDSDINNETGLPIFNTVNSLTELNNSLKLNNSKLLIKLHPAQNLDFINMNEYENIKFLLTDDIENNNYHLYNLVAEADALITDYSSIYFDYLLLNRPIAFTIDDINSYLKNRGFIVDDPYSLMPGNKIENCSDFKNFIADISANNNDIYEKDRHIVNNLANKYQDNRNCERIIDLISL